jgi:RNA recognition motif-containing protein
MDKLKEETISEKDKYAVVDDDKVLEGNHDSEKEPSTDTLPEQLQTNISRDKNPLVQFNPNNRATSNTLFMTGICHSLSKIHIERLFGKFGHVHRVDVKTSKTGSMFCFCEMDSIENAQKAIDNLNGRMLLSKRLVVRPAHDKNGNSRPTALSSSHINPVRERKMLDRKIEELKQRINMSKS